MSRRSYVESDAALHESSDEEKSNKITIPKFTFKTVDTYGLLCEQLRAGALHGEPSSFDSHELPNRPRTARTRSRPVTDPDLRIPAAFGEYVHDRPPYVDNQPRYNLLELRCDRDPSHIARQTPSVPNENYINKPQESHVDDLSQKGNVSSEEAGCSSQTVRRTNVSDVHALTYKLDKFSENHMIIFNHENFLEDTRREGSARDVASLRKTFEPLRFSVTVHKDLEEAELFTTLKEFSKQDFRRCGCICVAILSHGSDHGVLEAFDGWYSERAVFACFNTTSNSTLTDKPIIFLIQACRGRNLALRAPVPEPDEPPTIELDSGNISKAGYSLPAESNMIIFHSSFFGRASARDRHKGSWFIQTVCEQIDLYAASEDLEKIFMRVRNIVARKETGGRKQMPITSSALTKHLFLK